MNELKSYTEYAVSTPTADFVIGFDFNYGEDAVNVTVDNVPAAEAGYTVVYINETTIRLSPSVPSGIVRLQRETDIDQSEHAYRAGAKFIAQTMDENFEQLRHSQQEVRDGFSKLKRDTYSLINGLDEALELAQDAAQDAQDAAVIAQDAADTVNAIIVGGKVAANKVLDSSGKTQQEINDSVITKSGETVKDALYYVTTGAEAIAGDGSDEGAKLSDLFVKWDGHVIDLRGQTVSINSPLYVNFTKPTTLRNGKIKYIGTTNVEAATTLTTTTKLILENFNAESTNASKTLRVLAASDSAELEVDGGTFKGGKQKTGFGFAAGLHIARLSAGFKFKRVVTNNANPQDVDSEIVNGVGRGVYVSDFEYAELNNTKPERVGPYYDGDGIFAQENNTPNATLIIDGVVGIDCQKRVVKSQVINSTVTNITAIRTQSFPYAAGQCEVSLQSGGSLDGLQCFYADGAAPDAIVSNIGGFGGGLSGAPLKNITVVCANPNNIINKIAVFEHALANTSITGYELSHVSLNCRINNIATFYSAAGMTAIDYAFKDVVINDIKCTEILSDAFVVQRGVAKYVRVSALISNIAAKNGKANLYLLDPTAGTTTWLFFYATRASNIRGINIDNLQTSVDTAQRVFTKYVDVNENAAANLSFDISLGRGAVKVIAIYNPNRDSATANLYTEGMVFNGQSQAYYVETTVGNKSQAGQGALSIAVSGRTVTLSKSAGTLTGSGRLQLMLIHSSLIDTV